MIIPKSAIILKSFVLLTLIIRIQAISATESLARAAGSNSLPPFSTYTFSDPKNGPEIIIGLNVPSSSDDLYFHISTTDTISWVAFGFGSSMFDSALTFVAYRSSNGTSLTISPRLATRHAEPKHEPVKDIEITLLQGSGISNGRIVVNAQCSSCRSWTGNSVDVFSTQQEMIVASKYGNEVMMSDDLDARLLKHSNFGTFVMDMVRATSRLGDSLDSGTGGPAGESRPGTGDGAKRTAHAALMIYCFLVLLPSGVLYLRVLESVRLHNLNNTIVMFLIVIGTILGINLPIKTYLGPHQLVGLLCFFLVLAQFTLGHIHHAIFIRTHRSTPLIRIHHVIGPIVMCLGILNGYLGLRVAGSAGYVVMLYALAVFVSGVVCMGFIWWKKGSTEESNGGKDAVPWMNRVREAFRLQSDVELRDEVETDVPLMNSPGNENTVANLGKREEAI